MIPQVKEYLLDNWQDLIPGADKPHDLSFLKLESRQGPLAVVSFLVFLGDQNQPAFLLKIPRDPGNKEPLKREFDSLSYIHNRVSSIRDSIPKPVFLREINGTPVMMESAVNGKKLDRIYRSRLFGRRNLLKYSALSRDWLARFHTETARTRQPFDQKTFDGFVTIPLSQFADNLDREMKQKLGPHFSHVTETLAKFQGEQLPIVAEHGDFNPFNIMVSKAGLSVVDWEDCRPEGLPFVDVLQYLTIVATFAEKRPLGPWLFEGQAGPLYRNLAADFVKGYCAAMKVSPEMLAAFYPVYLMRMANKELEPQRDNRANFNNWAKLVEAFAVSGKDMKGRVSWL